MAKCQLLLIGVLALLVGDAAAGLASGLAGGLALAAATVLSALAQVTGFQSLDSFHNSNLPSLVFLATEYTATLIMQILS